MEKGMYNGVPVINKININKKIFKPEIVNGNLLFPVPTNFAGFDIVYIEIEKEVLLKIIKDVDDLK